MTEPTTPTEALSPVKRALLEIRELRARLAALESAAREPIAITGIALRFPGGAVDLESFARLLWDGVNAVTTIPADRWDVDAVFDTDPDAPGKMFTRHGGFIDGVDQFDAEFFGINPREAASMDPQQRLALQVAWEALENAGQSPAALMGSRTGVYLGIANTDYGRALYAHPDLIDVYFSTGTAYSVASGRLSYFLGARGPAISVDTACSSSLVALHLACQALRAGECDLALAGGVNLILTPEMNINFSKARMMAPDGRCKTFDADADGYVRGEGVAFVVLERLSDARKRHRRIHALVRGSAVNQDGRSNGLTAPNGPSQEAVIRAALENAGVRATDVAYVETHGTGTSLGDPIEVQALGAALGHERSSSNPLMIGSVKTNVGHLEAAAGVAGLVKAVLALQRGEIPPHLHLRTPSPLIDWVGLNVTVPTTRTPLPRGEGRRIVGVSSFGFSGTNAHVILEEAPEDARVEVASLPDRPRHVLPISARDADTLRRLAQRHADGLATCTDIAAWCHTAGAGRAHFAHRVSVSGATVDELRAGLAAFLDGRAHPSVVAGHAQAKPRVAFLFTGQGPQHAGMARTLYETLPVFRETFDACVAVADPLLPTPLRVLLYENADAGSPIDDARLAQPALFAVELALAAVWRSWGIEPAAVLGHSFGEYVAAAVAGVMSVEDAMRAVVERTRLVHEHAPPGAMAAVFAPEDVVSAAIADLNGRVVIATLNGPDHVVISGPRDDVEHATARFEANGTRAKVLHVSYASHAPLMEPVLSPFARALENTRFSPPAIPLVSNLTGTFAEPNTIDAAYWCEHLRKPVRFADAMRTLAADGITHYLEIGPHPVLLGIGAACVPAPPDAWLPSLRRDADDWTTLLTSVQQAYAAGATIDWEAFDAPWPRAHADVPTYPFRTRRYWLDSLGIHAESASVDPWAEVSRAMDRASLQGPLDLDAARYPRAWKALARLTSAHAARFLHRAGLFARAGETRSLDDVMRLANVGESYRRLMRRRLDALVAEGVLRIVDGGWTCDAPLADPDMAPLWADAERELANNQELLAYVRHCGSLMDDVLTGRVSPLETLFPGGSSSLAIGLYQHSQTMRWVNGLASAALQTLGAVTRPGQMRRVLEVGAGTGGTSSALLQVLPADRTDYVFTDVSDFFFHEARERFEEYPFVRYARFDVDRDAGAQGFAAGSFDVIVSANALHASRDLRAALTRLRDLLAPGGMLVLVESTTHHAWFDMTTGLIEGWQHFADDLRDDHPLLDAETWTRVLREVGFVNAQAWPGAGSVAESLGQHVIVAQVAGVARAHRASRVDQSGAGVDAREQRPDPAREQRVQVGASEPVSVRERLVAALPDERAELLREIGRDAVVRVLRLDPADAPSRKTRLMELGIDSLMAVQLRNLLGQSLELDRPLPATLIFDYPTIDALAAFLETRLALPAPVSAPTTPSPTATPALGAAAIAALSDDEIERLLLERLEPGQ